MTDKLIKIVQYHLISEHSNGDIPPSIPGQLLVKIIIVKEEENALGIQKKVTDTWRERNNILIVMAFKS